MYIDLPTKCSKVTFHLMDTSSKILLQIVMVSPIIMRPSPDPITGSRGDVFVIWTSKPIENLWKNGLFWLRYSFVTHSIGRKPRDWGLARSARASGALWATAFGHPSGDVPCASENMDGGYWFSKVDLGQIRSEEIVYSRFIKIAIG